MPRSTVTERRITRRKPTRKNSRKKKREHESHGANRGVDEVTINKDIDETARKYGISREDVINKLKGSI